MAHQHEHVEVFRHVRADGSVKTVRKCDCGDERTEDTSSRDDVLTGRQDVSDAVKPKLGK